MTEEKVEPSPDVPPEIPPEGTEKVLAIPQWRRSSILIALVVLVIALVGLTAWSYTTLNGEIGTLQTQLTALNETHAQYVAMHSHNDTEYNELVAIINLEKSSILTDSLSFGQDADTYTSFTYQIPYAGYISITVQSSTSNTYVRVIYNAFGVVFDETLQVGTSGTAVFPLLPSNDLEVRVGNTNLVNEATETVTITYHY